ncbi:MAG TPA: hypothetical protein PKK94_27895 [Leptospiraceae bacterium]|nr:hypothetical protein [Leptospiraceae bacterium]
MTEKPGMEFEKISHLLNTDESELKYLLKLEEEEIGHLRMKVGSAILEEQSGIWEPLAKVTKFMPNFVNAKISEEVLGPKISANITYHLSASDAVSISGFMSAKFFCDVLEHLIPEKIEFIIRATPLEQMRKAMNELKRRKNYFLIGSLIDYTPVPSVEKLSKEMDDAFEILEILHYTAKKDRMLSVIESFGEDKLFRIWKKGIELDGSRNYLDIFRHASDSLTRRLKSFYGRLDSEEQSRLKVILEKYELSARFV